MDIMLYYVCKYVVFAGVKINDINKKFQRYFFQLMCYMNIRTYKILDCRKVTTFLFQVMFIFIQNLKLT